MSSTVLDLMEELLEKIFLLLDPISEISLSLCATRLHGLLSNQNSFLMILDKVQFKVAEDKGDDEKRHGEKTTTMSWWTRLEISSALLLAPPGLSPGDHITPVPGMNLGEGRCRNLGVGGERCYRIGASSPPASLYGHRGVLLL